MKKRMNKTKGMSRKLFAAAMTAAMALPLAACGADTDQNNTNGGDTKEYVYVPEYVTVNMGEDSEEGASYYNAVIKGDYLYFPKYTYEEESGNSGMTIYRSSLDNQGVCEPTAMSYDTSSGNRSMNSFTLDDEGSFYTVDSSWDPDGGDSTYFICKYTAEGELVFEQDMTPVLAGDEENSYINNMVVDQEGNVYASSNSKIFLFDAAGAAQGYVDINGNYLQAMGMGKDGKIYISYWDNNSGDYFLAQVDFQSKSAGTVYQNYPNNSGQSMVPGIEKDFLVQDGSSLYEYDLASQSYEKLLDWLDCDINGSYVQKIALLSDNSLLVMTSDWDTGTSEILKLVKTKASEVPQKIQIVVGSLYDDYTLNSEVVNFNKQNTEYRISVKTYIDNNNWTENSYSDAITNFNNEIISGNGPDIISLNGMAVEQLASKGVLEDLTSYLDKSSVLKKEDLIENVLEGYTVSGILVGIPKQFNIETIVGRASDLGTEPGWALEEMMAYADEYPDAALFSYGTKAAMLQYCLNYNMDDYIDWESGECKFDTPEFVSLLEFIARFPDEIDWESDQRSEPKKIQDGDVLLSTAYISNFQDIQQYPAIFGEDVNFIGYPNADGDAGCMLTSNDAYGISSKSANKDAAWSFLEGILTSENTRNSWGFSTNRNRLQQQIEDELNVEYLKDENGELMLDELGEAIPVGGTSGIGYGDWEYTFHTTTQEEVDQTVALIEAAKPQASGNVQIMTIVNEETESFFQEQKAAADVAAIIQSRVQIYVNENR